MYNLFQTLVFGVTYVKFNVIDIKMSGHFFIS